MNPLVIFRAFAHEDMPPVAPALQHSSITTTCDSVTSLADKPSSRITYRTSIDRPLITAARCRAASPIDAQHSPTITKSNNAACPSDTQRSRSAFGGADAASCIIASHSAKIATSDQAASHAHAEQSPTATASNNGASFTKTCPVTPLPSAPKAPAQGQPTYKVNTPRRSTTFGKPELLTIPAGDILTALIQSQANLPNTEVILATENPLGMMIATEKKFVLLGGKIRYNRVMEWYVL